jgi:transcriptional regulator
MRAGSAATSGIFDPPNEVAVLKLIAEHPLAWVVSSDGARFAATPLPLLAECDDEGRLISLLGHIGRSNPQLGFIEDHSRAMVLFSGPHSYISPSLVSNLTWGPTWNYATAQFTVDISLIPDETDHALTRLAEAVEKNRPKPWQPSQLGTRYRELSARIVAFRARIVEQSSRFKLGQDEHPETFREIVAALGEDALARWMEEMGRGAS